MTAQRRLAAILVTDVVGFSRLVGADETGTLARLATLRREVVDPEIARHAGRLFKETGDGFLAEFASAVQAVTCAMDIQKAAEAGSLPLRIGIHVGDVVVQGDDLMGDGVNIAARIEGIADPGGIAVSRAVYEQVRDRLDVGFADKGEIELKNIGRPVHIFAVGGPGVAPAAPTLTLPDKPSIAVLPFQNMSGDPEQEYFTDGVSEDIITELSRFTSLFVIARNSSFTYKGKAVDIKQVGRELGVRYVLEGSIRRASSRIRVTGQLIDTVTGNHIWAERYDRVLEDIFAVQEEVTQAIVSAIAPQIEIAEIGRSRVRPGNLSAYELAMRAWADAWDSFVHSNSASRARAMAQAQEAVSIDPRCGLALTTLGYCHFLDINFGTTPDLEASRAAGVAATTLAIEIDPGNSLALLYRGAVRYYAGQRQAGIEDMRRALQRNPNDVRVLQVLSFTEAAFGDAARGIELGLKALRLSPRDRAIGHMHGVLANAYFYARRYGEGLQEAEAAAREMPASASAHAVMALNLVGLGRVPEARVCVETIRRLAPAYLQRRLDGRSVVERPDDLKHATVFLRIAAGLEDPSAAEVLR